MSLLGLITANKQEANNNIQSRVHNVRMHTDSPNKKGQFSN